MIHFDELINPYSTCGIFYAENAELLSIDGYPVKTEPRRV